MTPGTDHICEDAKTRVPWSEQLNLSRLSCGGGRNPRASAPPPAQAGAGRDAPAAPIAAPINVMKDSLALHGGGM